MPAPSKGSISILHNPTLGRLHGGFSSHPSVLYDGRRRHEGALAWKEKFGGFGERYLSYVWIQDTAPRQSFKSRKLQFCDVGFQKCLALEQICWSFESNQMFLVWKRISIDSFQQGPMHFCRLFRFSRWTQTCGLTNRRAECRQMVPHRRQRRQRKVPRSWKSWWKGWERRRPKLQNWRRPPFLLVSGVLQMNLSRVVWKHGSRNGSSCWRSFILERSMIGRSESDAEAKDVRCSCRRQGRNKWRICQQRFPRANYSTQFERMILLVGCEY